MHHIYLDPQLFACPAVADGKAAFDSFLQGILLLRDLRGAEWSRTFITETTSDLLWEAKRYPLQNDLHASMAAFNEWEEVQTKDVVDIVNGLLKTLPSIEGYVGISALLFENFETSPGVDLGERQRPLKDGFSTILVFSALAGQLRLIPEEKQISVSRGLRTTREMLRISAEIVDADGETRLSLPYKASGGCWLCQSWGDVHSCLNPEELWTSDPFGTVQAQALSSHVWQQLARGGGGGAEPMQWWFGRDFLRSAQALGFLHDPPKVKNILRACCETVLQLNMRSTHGLRTGKGGEDPQVTRGADKGWRRDIDYEFHLHYWEGPGGVEFACVTVHNDFGIPP